MTGGGRDGGSLFVTAQDGLRLHVQEYGSRTAPGVPVVCLPGLTRTVSDFDALAPALANDMALPRRVIAINSRGRGQSDYDSNPDNYNLAVELADVATVLTALGVRPAVFIGSSRGGLLTMLMGVAHPTAIAGAVLHDIGPVIELKGLVRLKSYVGKLPTPRSFADGAEILRRLFAAQFPLVTAEGWLAAAHRTWLMKDGALTPTYDVRLARTLADIDIERPLPPLWKEFELASCACPCWSSAAGIPTFCRSRRSRPWRRIIPGCSRSKCPIRAMFRRSRATSSPRWRSSSPPATAKLRINRRLCVNRS